MAESRLGEFLDFSIGQFAQTVHDGFVTYLFQSVNTLLYILLQRHIHPAFHNNRVDGCLRIQEKPTVKYISTRDFVSVKQGT